MADVTIVVDGKDSSSNAFNSAVNNEKKLENATESLNKIGEKASKALTDGLKKVSNGADDAGKKTERFGSKFKSAIHDQAQQGVDGLLGRLGQTGAVLGKLGGIGIAAGAAIGAGLAVATTAANKLKEAFDIAVSRDTANRKLGAQLGLSPEEMKTAGKIAGQVYADNFGESISDINTTIKAVMQNMRGVADMSAGSVKAMTEEISTLMQTTGEDAAAISRAASQLIRTGLVDDPRQAFDLIQKGFQLGDDKAQDLLDTFNEYGTQFRKLGLDGTQALGLIDQAIKAGARDSDIAADALKEFSIRAVDGSTTTANGFKMLGLNAKDMAERIGKGGASASGALQLTLDKLRAIKDPVKQAQAAVALFGTQAEDLGASLYAMNLGTATDQMHDMEGATKRASDTMSGGFGAAIETAKRKLETLKAQLGEKLFPVVQYFIDKIWPKMAAGIKIVADKFQEFWQKAGPPLLKMLHNLEDEWDKNKDSIAKLKPFLEYLGTFLGVALVSALVVVGGLIGLFIEYLGKVGDTLSGAKKGFDSFITSILILFGRIIDGAVAAFGWIPGIGPKLKAAQAQFHAFADNVIADIARSRGVASSGINVAVKVSGMGNLYAIRDQLAWIAGHQVVSVGLGHRAAGGVASGLTEVGERGSELLNLPQGSMVYPAANARMMTEQSSGGAMLLKVAFDTTGASDELANWIRKAFRFDLITVPKKAVV